MFVLGLYMSRLMLIEFLRLQWQNTFKRLLLVTCDYQTDIWTDRRTETSHLVIPITCNNYKLLVDAKCRQYEICHYKYTWKSAIATFNTIRKIQITDCPFEFAFNHVHKPLFSTCDKFSAEENDDTMTTELNSGSIPRNACVACET